MNKKLVAASALLTLLALPLATFAITFTAQPAEVNVNIIFVIQNILTLIWYVFMALVCVLFIIAGIQFLTAQGEPSKLETARQFVVWGVAGVVVGILAFSIITIVRNTLLI